MGEWPRREVERANPGAPAPRAGLLPAGEATPDGEATPEPWWASDEAYRALFDHSLDAIILCDGDGTVQVANRAACLLIGAASEAELEGRRVTELVDPEDLRTLIAIAERDRLGRFRGQARARRLDGEIIPVEVASSRFRDRHGHVHFATLVRDLRERQVAEARARSLEEQLGRVLRISPIGVGVADLATGELLTVNRHFQELFGFTEAELVGRSSLELGLWADPGLRDHLVTELRRHGSVSDFEMPARTRSGEPRSLLLNVEGFTFDGREALLLALLDITERQRREAALATSEEHYRTLVSAMREGVILCLADGTLATMNESAARILGVSRAEFLVSPGGPPGTVISREDGTPLPRCDVPTNVALRTGATQSGVVIGWRLPGRRQQWLRLESQPLRRPEDAAPYAVVTTFADITAERETRTALQESEARLRAMFDHTALGFALFDERGACVRANPAFGAMLGLAPAAVTGLPLDRLLPAASGPAGCDLEQLRRTGVAWRRDSHVRRPDGRGVMLRLAISRVSEAAGSAEGMLVAVEDNTERQREQELDRLLLEIERRGLEGDQLDLGLGLACDYLVRAFDASCGWIELAESDGRLRVHAEASTGAAPVAWRQYLARLERDPRGGGSGGLALRAGRSRVADPRHDRDDDLRAIAQGARLCRYLVVPFVEPGRVIGAVHLLSAHAAAFEPEAVRRIEATAARLTVALALARGQQQLRLQSAAIATAANAVFITDRAGRIQWVNQAFTQMSGFSAAEAVGQTPRILKSGLRSQAEYRSMWASILAGEVWRGELVDRRRDGSLYTVIQTITPIRDSQGEVSHFVTIHEDITAQKEAEASVRRLAHFDAVTGLPNRILFRDRLEQGLLRTDRHHGALGLMFVDLDRFKTVNDTLGHDAGDRLLQAVAGRMTAQVRASDTVARWAGDEFVVLLSDLIGPPAASRIAEAIRAALSAPFDLGGHTVSITPSIGVALYPGEATTAEGLIRAADAAMYHAKEGGRNRVELYDAELHERVTDRLRLEGDLEAAVARGEFILHYQPIWQLPDRRLVGAEALLRWRHPDLGLISPGVFLDVLEESRWLEAVSTWVLREACAQAVTWPVVGAAAPRLAVNVSPRLLRHDRLSASIGAVLAETGLSPERLELELTETAMFSNASSVPATLRAIREQGVRLSLDDFGTGYASLTHLKRFPVDRIKIDRSLARTPTDPGDAAIASAVITLAHGLGLAVTAEGIEEEAQLQWLLAHHCDEVQGFLLSRPVDAAAIADLIRREAAGEAGPAVAAE